MRGKRSDTVSGLWLGGLAALAMLAWAGCASGPRPVVKDATPGEIPGRVVAESAVVATESLHGADPEASPEPGGIGAITREELSALEYRIEAGDVLEFRSLDDESLSRSVTVRYDGHISLPLVPDITVENRTRDEATAMVRDAYSAVFIDPQVSLSITQPTSKTFHVMGDVSNPNEYPYTRPISVLDAINNAGGPRLNQRRGESFVGARASLTKALVIRRYGGAREVIECDLSGFAEAGPFSSDILVMPRDIIYVPEGVNLVYVLGEVRTPDVYQLIQGTKLLQLLTRAGGPTPSTARLGHVVLLREVADGSTQILVVDVKQILKTGQDIEMKAGDIVYIPRKPLITVQEFVGRFTSSTSPLMSLYRQAWDTWYTKRRYDTLFDSSRGGGANELLTVLQSFRDVSSLATSIPMIIP